MVWAADPPSSPHRRVRGALTLDRLADLTDWAVASLGPFALARVLVLEIVFLQILILRAPSTVSEMTQKQVYNWKATSFPFSLLLS